MSDHSISIVPVISCYPDAEKKEKEILQWLAEEKIIQPNTSDCILGGDGYPIADGAVNVVIEPEYLPFNLIVNGLEIVTRKNIFHTGQNGVEELFCSACKQDLAGEDWDFFGRWLENSDDCITCPRCSTSRSIHDFTFVPQWGFSDIGFVFWNWPNFTKTFVEEFELRLGCRANIVHTWI
ncbi:MAG TPA: hypothetical protein VG738_18070 [Chitinophagaceae bacterium]|nr:hypothetical protein [Chitinophagaceae bacterium]